MNFLVLFFMFNWLPPLMEQAGFPVERAIIATVLFNLGGIVGGIALGRAMDKYGNYAVVGTAYAFGALFLGLVGFLVFSIPLLMSALLLAGFCSVGTQVCGNALAASLYPTAVRSTGVGWGLRRRPHRLDRRPHPRRNSSGCALATAQPFPGRGGAAPLRGMCSVLAWAGEQQE